MRIKLWPGVALLAAAALFGVVLRDRLPATMATHWGADGQVNGWSPRGLALLLLPGIGLLTAGVLAVAPKLDPRYRNFPAHAGEYWLVGNAVLGLLALIHAGMLAFALGWIAHLESVVGVGIGVLFMLMGNVLTRVRANWIFGVRTPWTLSSDRAWRQTHRLAGYGFVLAGFVTLVAALFVHRALFAVMVAAPLAASLVAVVWSYVAWSRDPAAHSKDS